ncbi:MAG: hypothetical protein J0L84_15160 [Verrucomicrobia bacterium]|nr:hypothetical protein [Verrucomicrobiota bacterium]
MGAWGTAIFSDDTAADVRDEFRDHIGDGLSPEIATSRLTKEYASSLKDSDEAPAFWLGLAAAQWNLGRLLPEVLANALQVIDDGTDLRRLDENKPAQRQRKAVLEQLRSKLLAPQPACKRVPKRYRQTNTWKNGQVIGYRLANGQLCLFRIIGQHSDNGGSSPIAELIDWLGTEIPLRDCVEFLPIRHHRYANGTKGVSQFLLGNTSAREFPHSRVIETDYSLKPAQHPGGFTVFLWRYLDSALCEYFDIGH